MNRREFLRRSVPVVLAGGVFVPQFGPWFRQLTGLWARDYHGEPLNRIWRKVQGEILVGYNFETTEWARISGPLVVSPIGGVRPRVFSRRGRDLLELTVPIR